MQSKLQFQLEQFKLDQFKLDMIRILEIEGWGFLGLLGAILAYRLLTRQINLSGLLLRKNGSGSPSPERVQLLLATMAVGFKYLSEVFSNPGSGKLPDIDAGWLYVLGGSSAVYVLGKAFTTFKGVQENSKE
jgi:hypothetical protein